jgi:hypothetical protein
VEERKITIVKRVLKMLVTCLMGIVLTQPGRAGEEGRCPGGIVFMLEFS